MYYFWQFPKRNLLLLLYFCMSAQKKEMRTYRNIIITCRMWANINEKIVPIFSGERLFPRVIYELWFVFFFISSMLISFFMIIDCDVDIWSWLHVWSFTCLRLNHIFRYKDWHTWSRLSSLLNNLTILYTKVTW